MKSFNITKDLNIQKMPTHLIFLGRSFITIEGMLHIISPNKELIEIAKPAFLQWLNQSNQSKWKLVWKWINAQPIFKVFHSISPQRFIELKEMQQQREFHFSIYENQKKQTFFLGVLGLLVSFLVMYLHDPVIIFISSGLVGARRIHNLFIEWHRH